MNERELERLAELIAIKQAAHPPKCIAFNEADIAGIKALASAYNEGQRAVRRGIISVIALGAIAIFILGCWEYIKRFKT